MKILNCKVNKIVIQVIRIIIVQKLGWILDILELKQSNNLSTYVCLEYILSGSEISTVVC